MISEAFPTKGTARNAAKEYAQANGMKKFTLMLDLDKRQYHFSDQEEEASLIAFARYALVKGKWQDKTMLGKAVSRGGKVIKQ